MNDENILCFEFPQEFEEKSHPLLADYLSRMAGESNLEVMWGSEHEIFAMATFFGVPIFVFYSTTGTWTPYHPMNGLWADEEETKRGQHAIYLLHEPGHFKVVTAVDPVSCHGILFEVFFFPFLLSFHI